MEKIPTKIFIVPYRNRIQHKFFFSKYMSYILEDDDDYEIFFSHQCDSRTFNRGAVKNIGFIAAKQKYPEHYQDITFIFNDVDTIPFCKIFDYKTTHGTVKHYYGFKYALGGIVVIKGSDFEKINGYPCFWGWGMEDNVLQKRCELNGLIIDRSVFYEIGSPEILQLFDGITRIISKKDAWRGEQDNGRDGICTITDLTYTISEKSNNPNDNIFVVHNPKIKIININTFLTFIPFGHEEYYIYDLREPKQKVFNPDKIKETKKNVIHTSEWSNIPHYPTAREKRENIARYLLHMGRQIPPILLKQIEQDKMNEIAEDHFNKNVYRINKNDHNNLNEQQYIKSNTQPNFVNNRIVSNNYYKQSFYRNYNSHQMKEPRQQSYYFSNENNDIIVNSNDSQLNEMDYLDYNHTTQHKLYDSHNNYVSKNNYPNKMKKFMTARIDLGGVY